MLEYIKAFFLLILLDIPWLAFQTKASETMIAKIQGGRALVMRLWTAPVVYAALSYLLVQQKSVKEAAAAGVATYAVYEFTNMAIFKDYSLSFALQDTAWGGVLFALAHTILKIF